MTETQLQEFVTFQENYDAISTMIAGGVLTLKNGKAIVSFDKIGRVADIELQYHTFRLQH